jgi:prepilin-type N-terminal cleavage/methylation domain-containing protein
VNYQKQHFTLLELLIAVLILAVVSSVIVGVFQETLKHYTKGMIYAEISESLAGGFMVIESDLNRMLPLGDKETIFFKENSFSFIAINKTEQNK